MGATCAAELPRHPAALPGRHHDLVLLPMLAELCPRARLNMEKPSLMQAP
jgi:hypothetical protein